MPTSASPSSQSILLQIQQHKDRISEKELNDETRALAMQYCLLNFENSAIFRLPNELLLKILKTYYEAEKCCKSDPRRCILNPFCIIPLTHICHHWRDLVLNTPTLWNEVDMTWLGWRLNFLPYSKDVPLELRNSFADESNKIVEYFTSSCLTQQIRVIDLDSPHPAAFAPLARISSLSQLQVLHLTFLDRKTEFPAFVYHLPNSIRSLKIHRPCALKKPLLMFLPVLHSL